jgi:hypothetical protein
MCIKLSSAVPDGEFYHPVFVRPCDVKRLEVLDYDDKENQRKQPAVMRVVLEDGTTYEVGMIDIDRLNEALSLPDMTDDN